MDSAHDGRTMVMTQEMVNKKNYRIALGRLSDITLLNYEDENDLIADLEHIADYNKTAATPLLATTICDDFHKIRKFLGVIVRYNVTFEAQYTKKFLTLEKMKDDFKKLEVFNELGSK